MKQTETPQFDPVVQTADATRLLGYRDRHSLWRLVREGKLAAPIKLTTRRSGWRLSTLEKFIADREKAA
jgi:prophage regulatory protein